MRELKSLARGVKPLSCQRRQRRTGSLLAVRCRLPANRFAGAAGFDSAAAAASAFASGADSVAGDGALVADAASEAFAKAACGEAGCDCTDLLAGVSVAIAALVDTGDATAETGAPVTSACAAMELSASAPGRSSRDTTTAAPAVAPTAVATSTIRAPRRKLGAGAR